MAVSAAAASSRAEQARLLTEHRQRVASESYAMKRAADARDLNGVIKHAAAMISELQTGLLTPKSYFELYMEVFDQMAHLEMYFASLPRAGVSLSSVFEVVQYTGSVLVRLYLMITVCSLMIRTYPSCASTSLADILNMVKGVQHPQRGLFLRYYLIQKCKDKLPDAGTAYDGVGGSVHDAISFLIANFAEMNRLWVRMQHYGGNRNRKRRERERQELGSLIGSCLSNLGALNGLTLPIYETSVLPPLLDEIVACKDKIAQPYLMEYLVQTFPISYLFATLPTLLAALPKLVADHGVIKTVYVTLLGRIQTEALAARSEAEAVPEAMSTLPPAVTAAADNRVPGLPAEVDIFNTVLASLTSVVMQPNGAFRGEGADAGVGGADGHGSKNVPTTPSGGLLPSPDAVASLLEVYDKMLSFTCMCFPGHLPYVDSLLLSVAASLRDIHGLPPLNVTKQAAAAAAAAAAAPTVSSTTARSALSRLTGGAAGADAARPAAVEKPDVGVSADAVATDDTTLLSGSSMTVGAAMNLHESCSERVSNLLLAAQVALRLRFLSLENSAALMGCLAFRPRRAVAAKLLAVFVSNGERIDSALYAKRMCKLLAPLLRDEVDTPPETPETAATMLADLHIVAKALHLFGPTTDTAIAYAAAAAAGALAPEVSVDGSAVPTAETTDTDTHFEVLLVLREHLSHGGTRRLSHTFPPLVFSCLQLARRVRAREVMGVTVRITSKRIFQVLHEMCTALATTHTELALRLFLQCALAADASGFAAEFFSQAFILYEEVADSKAQLRCLLQLISALQSCRGMTVEQYEQLCARSTQLSVKLLKKADQVRCVLMCANLFWRGELGGVPEYRKPKEILRCLQKTLSIADSAMPPQPGLFVQIFSQYLYFFEKRCSSIEALFLNDLIVLCREQSMSMAPGANRDEVVAHYTSLMQHIRQMKESKEGAAIYADVTM